MDTSRILAEFRAERDRIQRAIAAIEGLDSTGRRRAGRPPQPTRKRRAFSAATRAKMAAAQRARWAKVEPAQTAKPARLRMSAAARNRIAAAQRARWAKVRVQQRAKKKPRARRA